MTWSVGLGGGEVVFFARGLPNMGRDFSVGGFAGPVRQQLPSSTAARACARRAWHSQCTVAWQMDVAGVVYSLHGRKERRSGAAVLWLTFEVLIDRRKFLIVLSLLHTALDTVRLQTDLSSQGPTNDSSMRGYSDSDD